ncbi:MAG: hypothetical protein IOD15_13560 [Phycisphaerales bacterium]|nr:hypothetical protein [Phycisphaerales bacterium]
MQSVREGQPGTHAGGGGSAAPGGGGAGGGGGEPSLMFNLGAMLAGIWAGVKADPRQPPAVLGYPEGAGGAAAQGQAGMQPGVQPVQAGSAVAGSVPVAVRTETVERVEQTPSGPVLVRRTVIDEIHRPAEGPGAGPAVPPPAGS